MNDYLKKAQHPAISWSVIVVALGLGGTSLNSANEVENLAMANQLEIRHEKELRISEQSGIKEDLGELKEDTKQLARTLKIETDAIKQLLQQLLLRQAASAPATIN